MTKNEALKLAVDGLEKILCAFEKDGKFVMKSMIRNELFDEVNLLLKKSKKVLAKPEERNLCPRCGKRTADIHTCTPPQSDDEFCDTNCVWTDHHPACKYAPAAQWGNEL